MKNQKKDLVITIFVTFVIMFAFIMTSAQAESVGSNMTEATTLYVIPNSGVNVRERPNTKSDIIGQYDRNQAVTLTGNFDGYWAEVQTEWVNTTRHSDGTTTVSDKLIGWVYIANLSEEEPYTDFEVMVIGNGRLKVRDEPAGNHSYGNFVNEGDMVSVQGVMHLRDGTTWCRILYRTKKADIKGWVNSEFLAIDFSEPVAEENIEAFTFTIEDDEPEFEELGENEFPEFTYSKDWGDNDSYLLAKFATCEAGNQDIYTKTLVIMTVLNRVWDYRFPGTIEEVIFQESNGVYQFSSVGDGSWDRNEPDEDSWVAVNMAMQMQYDYSAGALYFETCEDEDNWYSRNLEFLYQYQGMRFYK